MDTKDRITIFVSAFMVAAPIVFGVIRDSRIGDLRERVTRLEERQRGVRQSIRQDCIEERQEDEDLTDLLVVELCPDAEP